MNPRLQKTLLENYLKPAADDSTVTGIRPSNYRSAVLAKAGG